MQFMYVCSNVQINKPVRCILNSYLRRDESAEFRLDPWRSQFHIHRTAANPYALMLVIAHQSNVLSLSNLNFEMRSRRVLVASCSESGRCQGELTSWSSKTTKYK